MSHPFVHHPVHSFVVLAGPDRAITWVSPYLAKVFGEVAGAWIGQSLDATLLDGATPAEASAAAAGGGEELCLQYDIRLRQARGILIGYRLAVHTLLDVGGACAGFVATVESAPARPMRPGMSRGERKFRQAYPSSTLTHARAAALFDRFESAMLGERLYLSSDVSVGSMARRLGSNTQYVSQVVNFFTGARFSHYVNQLRLEAFAEHYRSGAAADAQEPWLAFGFGSYSAFYRALRAERDVSPTEFFGALAQAGPDRARDPEA